MLDPRVIFKQGRTAHLAKGANMSNRLRWFSRTVLL